MPLINVNYVGDDDYECDKASCRVRRGETIEWECHGSGHYAIALGWNWPLNKKTLSAPLGKRISLPIPRDLALGRYKYTLVVFDADKGEFFVDDPEFLVKP